MNFNNRSVLLYIKRYMLRQCSAGNRRYITSDEQLDTLGLRLSADGGSDKHGVIAVAKLGNLRQRDINPVGELVAR